MPLLGKICRARCDPFGTPLSNLELVAIGAVYIVPCESDMVVVAVNRRSRWRGAGSIGELGWKGKGLLSQAEFVM